MVDVKELPRIETRAFMGGKALAVHDRGEQATVRFVPPAGMTNPHGTVQGGFVAAMIDEEQILHDIRRGRAHLGGMSLQGLASIVPEFNIAMVPYVFDSAAEVRDRARHFFAPWWRMWWWLERTATKALPPSRLRPFRATKACSDYWTARTPPRRPRP